MILQNWLRQPKRLALLLLGVLIMSGGLSYLFILSNSNKGTVVDNLQKKWKSSYDIVVRPQHTDSLPEKGHKLLEPNYLSNIPGGISIMQYKEIKRIKGVAITAPIAMIGYAGMSINYTKKIKLSKPGIYQIVRTNTDFGDIQDTLYVSSGKHFFINEGMDIHKVGTDLYAHSNQLLVGIDPEEEAKLVGLNHALEKHGKNQYFTDNNASTANSGTNTIVIPVLINPQPLNNFVHHTEIFKRDISVSDLRKLRSMSKNYHQLTWENGNDKNMDKEIAEDRQIYHRISGYLDKQKNQTKVFSYMVPSSENKKIVFNGTLGINPESGEKNNKTAGVYNPEDPLFYQVSSLAYQVDKSPYEQRWPIAYQIDEKQLPNPDDFHILPTPVFRSLNNAKNVVNIRFNVLGYFDATKLKLSKNPTNHLPMETYQPPSANQVLDKKHQPINPPKAISSTGSPVGLLTQEPTMLTTLDAAEKINGKKPISAIRIRVSGVEDMGKASQARVNAIAHKIEKKTGLMATVTLGSSPQPILLHVVQKNGTTSWMEQPWIQLDAAMTIFQETMFGYSGMIAALMAVAVIYVLATNFVSLLARRKNFATLLAVGWRVPDLIRYITVESGLLACVALAISFCVSLAWFLSRHTLSLINLVIMSLCIITIYGLGTLIPAYLVSKITPYEALKQGEISILSQRFFRTSGLISLIVNSLFGKFGRQVLSILAIAFPTALLSFFLFITFRLQGVLYMSYLGNYVAMKVGPAHYIAMGIALLISILTTMEITWQNIHDRRTELSLFKAVGWTNTKITRLIYLEGTAVGLLGGIIGLVLTVMIVFIMYGGIPVKDLPFLLLTGIIPVIVGFIGSLLPGLLFARQRPISGLKNESK